MGFIYRKSIRLGPFRVNVGKSGVGYSVGGRGIRTGVNSRGKRYTTFGLPGTGMSYRTSGSRKAGQGCLLLAVAMAALAVLLLKGIL